VQWIRIMVHWFGFFDVFLGGVLSVENGPLVPRCNVRMANLLLLHILSVNIDNWIRS
jgi:hypothetical protein